MLHLDSDTRIHETDEDIRILEFINYWDRVTFNVP